MQSDGPSQWAGGGINVSGEAPFEIRGFSLANAAALAGLAITSASFFEYFSTGGAGGLSGIGFVYGIPIALVGLALKVGLILPHRCVSRPFRPLLSGAWLQMRKKVGGNWRAR